MFTNDDPATYVRSYKCIAYNDNDNYYKCRNITDKQYHNYSLKFFRAINFAVFKDFLKINPYYKWYVALVDFQNFNLQNTLY